MWAICLSTASGLNPASFSMLVALARKPWGVHLFLPGSFAVVAEFENRTAHGVIAHAIFAAFSRGKDEWITPGDTLELFE